MLARARSGEGSGEGEAGRVDRKLRKKGGGKEMGRGPTERERDCEGAIGREDEEGPMGRGAMGRGKGKEVRIGRHGVGRMRQG